MSLGPFEALREAHAAGAPYFYDQAGGTNVWYESWNLLSEPSSALNAGSVDDVYFHGFIAPITGTFTHVRVRFGNDSVITAALNTPNSIRFYAGIYDNNQSGNINSPNDLLASGHETKQVAILGQTLDLTSQFLTIEINGGAGTPLTRGNLYWIGFRHTVTVGQATFHQNFGLYGTQASATQSGSTALSWQRNNYPSSSQDLPHPAHATSTTEHGAFWFIAYGPQTTLGATAGPTGAPGAKGDTGGTGPQGDKGVKGDTGEGGAAGVKGDKGDKGDRGDSFNVD